MKKMVSYCGINCFECPAYIATKENDDKKRKEVAKMWSEEFNTEIEAEEINCHGCLTDDEVLFSHCEVCEIRECGIKKEVKNCAYCEEYICDKLDKLLKHLLEEKETLDKINNTFKETNVIKPKIAETFFQVKDFEKQLKFYEKLLGVKAEVRYKNRWVTIVEGFGLYNPEFDIENDIDNTGDFDGNINHGNNSIVVFHTDDIEAAHKRAELLGVNSVRVSEIAELNLMSPYRFFSIKDPEGNIVEIGQYY